MATNMEFNDGTGAALVEVTCERDEDVFFGLLISRDDEEIVDLITTDPDEIENFFAEVRQAQAAWERLRRG